MGPGGWAASDGPGRSSGASGEEDLGEEGLGEEGLGEAVSGAGCSGAAAPEARASAGRAESPRLATRAASAGGTPAEACLPWPAGPMP